jgi:hypothetical protein
MNFTLKVEQMRDVHIQRLYADGQPTLILVTDEETVRLQRNGPTIDRAGLQSLFSTSPNRLEMLRNVLK